MQFAYHMFGATIGKLEVHALVKKKVKGKLQSVWTNLKIDTMDPKKKILSGPQQPSMKSGFYFAAVALPSTTTQVRFFATRGSSFTGDIAIDDVKISAQPFKPIKCTCPGGTPLTGKFCGGGVRCTKCQKTHYIVGDVIKTCKRKLKCKCPNGKPSVDRFCPKTGALRCASCNAGFGMTNAPNNPKASCKKALSGGNCGFETFLKCGWKSSGPLTTTGRDPWVWSQGGRVALTQTGTYTRSCSGTCTGAAKPASGKMYLFLEASWNRSGPKYASTLVSPKLPANAKSFTFQYHMHGSGVGTLDVSLYGKKKISQASYVRVYSASNVDPKGLNAPTSHSWDLYQVKCDQPVTIVDASYDKLGAHTKEDLTDGDKFNTYWAGHPGICGGKKCLPRGGQWFTMKLSKPTQKLKCTMTQHATDWRWAINKISYAVSADNKEWSEKIGTATIGLGDTTVTLAGLRGMVWGSSGFSLNGAKTKGQRDGWLEGAIDVSGAKMIKFTATKQNYIGDIALDDFKISTKPLGIAYTCGKCKLSLPFKTTCKACPTNQVGSKCMPEDDGQTFTVGGCMWRKNTHQMAIGGVSRGKILPVPRQYQVFPKGQKKWPAVACEFECACLCRSTDGCVSFDFQNKGTKLCRMFNKQTFGPRGGTNLGGLQSRNVPCANNQHHWEMLDVSCKPKAAPCPRGTQASGPLGTCVRCPRGTYWTKRDTCTVCPDNKYQNGYGQSSCKACPKGKTIFGTLAYMHDSASDCFSATASCTFESSRLCGWGTSGRDRGFGWVRGTRTGTGGTGANRAQRGRYFVYLETSAGAVNVGTEAALTTPTFKGYKSVNFYYHMYGQSTGKLMVQAKKGNKWSVVWMIEGQSQRSGNEPWHLAGANLPAGTTQVRFVATKGGTSAWNNYQGDISLDTVTFSNKAYTAPKCKCVGGSAVTGPRCDRNGRTLCYGCYNGYAKVGSACKKLNLGKCKCQNGIAAVYTCPKTNDASSFEDEDLGMEGWTHGPGRRRFTRGYRIPSGSVTGPSKAASGRYFVFLETSGTRPKGAGFTSTLQSPEYSSKVTKASFKYHMHGKAIGGLSLQGRACIGSSKTCPWKTLWSSTGMDAKKKPLFPKNTSPWKTATVDKQLQKVFPKGVVQLQITGVHGTGTPSYTGDVSIDEVKVNAAGAVSCQACRRGFVLKDGKCVAASTSCSFKNSFMCGWVNNGHWKQGVKTPSSGTGAAGGAATKVNGKGFAFLEASSARRGQISTLTSPTFTSAKSAEFYYHMHGKSMGTLSVEAYADSPAHYTGSRPKAPSGRSCKLDLAADLFGSKASTVNGKKATLHLYGHAKVTACGLQLDGDGDSATIDSFDYASDGSYTIGYWMSKSQCTSGPWEYTYSHNKHDNSESIFSPRNPGVNHYVGCQSSFIRTVIMGDNKDLISFDYDFHGSKAFSPLTSKWIHFVWAVSKQKLDFYVDGVLKTDQEGLSRYTPAGVYNIIADHGPKCVAGKKNNRYVSSHEVTGMNGCVLLNGFSQPYTGSTMRTKIHVGAPVAGFDTGNKRDNNARHVHGSIAGLQISTSTVCAKGAYNMYMASAAVLNSAKCAAKGWIPTGWTVSGQQHKKDTAAWTKTYVSLPKGTTAIRFVGKDGSSWQGDMSVDEVKVSSKVYSGPKCLCKNGIASVVPTECKKSGQIATCVDCKPGYFVSNKQCKPTTLACNFDKDTCGYTSDRAMAGGSLTMMWNRGTRTPSANTGSNKAHSGKYFMYLEVSPVRTGSETYLVSPTVRKGSVGAVMFMYHMYGADTGVLTVDAYDGVKWTTDLFKKVGQQQTSGNSAWHAAGVNLPAGTTQIRFGGMKGNDGKGATWEGDISIDSITTKPFPCNFVQTSNTKITCKKMAKPCPGDVKLDRKIDVEDLLAVLASWGKKGARIPADVKKDGAVNVEDLLVVLSNFGKTC